MARFPRRTSRRPASRRGGIPFDAKEITEAVEEAATEILREDGLAILSNLVISTPVGNPSLWKSLPPPGYVGGHARRNWNVTVNTKFDGELPGVDAGGQATISRGEVQINLFDSDDNFLAIQNGVPYINRLNDGWSSQAPAMFVQQAITLALSGPGDRENI